ncbi:hypothetical protein Daus18300_001900 [Diaporthe australafricana]|uniref:CHK kinase-like domain-containing protein n=1 Tax=Diaporthe australafricana TaxID=127596 RepID=A0ABR3XTN6_9PEZI
MSATKYEWLPVLPEDVTVSWLGSVLGHNVKTADMTRAIWGTESKLFFTLTYDDAGGDDKTATEEKPTHICIKGVFDPKMVAAQPWTALLAQREADFYSQMAPQVRSMGYPKAWWAGKADNQGIVIMNDLTAEGCTFLGPIETWPVDKVLEGVEQLAGLHGQYWGAKVEDHPYAVNIYDSSMQFLCAPWDDMTNRPDRPACVPSYLKDGARFNAAHDKYFATRNPKFRTIIHGDTHVGNTYLTAEGRPHWLDWSAVHVGSCFHDVAYFMCGALSIEDRRANEGRILRHYLDALCAAGGPRLDAADEDVQVEFKRSYIANCIWLICPFEMQPKEIVSALCERTVAAWEDHKILELIESQPDPVGV